MAIVCASPSRSPFLIQTSILQAALDGSHRVNETSALLSLDPLRDTISFPECPQFDTRVEGLNTVVERERAMKLEEAILRA